MNRRALDCLLHATSLTVLPILLALGGGACTSDTQSDSRQLAVEEEVVNQVPIGASWSYWDLDGAPPGDWKAIDYDTGDWQSGPAPLGYGESYVQTELSYGEDPSDKHITEYFRVGFVLAEGEEVASIRARMMYDDGAVIYLNGHEVERAHITGAELDSDTLADGHESGNNYEEFEWSEHVDHLVVGLNIIAVEVHQHDPASSDLTFDLGVRLLENADPLPEQIARRSDWSYWQEATPPPANWARADYDDDAWSQGGAPLGYGEPYIDTQLDSGDDPAQKTITHFFRKHIFVDDPADLVSIRGELMYDDGAAIYVNGQELGRAYLPSGALSPSTLALGHESGEAYQSFDWTRARDLLVSGENIIAVEVHQHDPASSDLVFDLALQLNRASSCGLSFDCAPITLADDTELRGIWIAPNGDTWAVGEDGAVGRQRSGESWCWCSPALNVDFNAVWGADENDIVLVGTTKPDHGGRVMRFDGNEFHAVPLALPGPMHAVWGSGADDIYVVGDNATVRHFDGATWESRDVEDSQRHLYDVWGLSADTVFVVGTHPSRDYYPSFPGAGSDAEIFRWDAALGDFVREAGFSQVFGRAAFYGIHGTDASNLWAVGESFPAQSSGGYALAARYDGTSWTQVALPEEVANARRYTAVVAGAPGAEDGAWITAGGFFGEPAVLYDGETYSESTRVTRELLDIDARSGQMCAVGRDAKFLRWNNSLWVRKAVQP